MKRNALYPGTFDPITYGHIDLIKKAAIEKSSSNTYVFKVAKDATKLDIKKSIEEIFGVKVDSVRVLNTRFKNKRTRFGKYKTGTYKKAYIKLEEGKEINLENPFK